MGARTHRIRERVSGDVFLVLDGAPLLRAMELAGCRAIAVGCRGGGCGVCKVRILSGDYTCGPMSRQHIADGEQAHGFVLACRVVPTSDLEIERLREPI
ncbi:2Fe-2S iron-sulfur cluster binding domain-containing protein [Pseudomonas sp. PS1(2021)]|uniref:2Fe-2S iron-sulfur cluster-binding protein n=1 Tax=Pseudomonas sp. PS1(2021) TaxID=2866282 RepID=UPI001CF062B1|nr:2Fe-2S iron-sulfur cluster-binding protein [Pseudomonas sp. PS1(2021)]UCM29524.1 2Fe-2S iron-sulfur cluster binding domain-containing protein [Pseudomonas sp. PS1(2021)]